MTTTTTTYACRICGGMAAILTFDTDGNLIEPACYEDLGTIVQEHHNACLSVGAVPEHVTVVHISQEHLDCQSPETSAEREARYAAAAVPCSGCWEPGKPHDAECKRWERAHA